jgi:hypothetical protein
MVLSELCGEIRNYFLRDREKDIHSGTFTISGGSISLPFLIDGQYFRVVGSVLNDGVYKYPAEDLTDETFDGSIWAMAVPKDVIALSDEIDEWNVTNAEKLASPFQSESFGGYSYTKASNGSSNGSSGWTWQDQFRTKLNRYRRLSLP